MFLSICFYLFREFQARCQTQAFDKEAVIESVDLKSVRFRTRCLKVETEAVKGKKKPSPKDRSERCSFLSLHSKA